MNLSARKSDVKNHLSRRVVRHLISPNPIGLPSDTSATEEPLTGNDPSNHLPSVDLGERPSSDGVYPQGSNPVQDR